MLVKQISVFVENKFGRLSSILKVLADNSIDISALSIADTTDFGILRLIVNDPEKAEQVLKDNGMTVKCTQVIAIAVEDAPGGLSNALDVLTDTGIVIEYIYAFVGKCDNRALVILRVDKPEEAIEALTKSDVEILDSRRVREL